MRQMYIIYFKIVYNIISFIKNITSTYQLKKDAIYDDKLLDKRKHVIPTSRCPQVKINRFEWAGSGRQKANKTCRNPKPIATIPKIECVKFLAGVVCTHFQSKSANITRKPVSVRIGTSNIIGLCRPNHTFVPHNFFEGKRCLQYQAMNIPVDAKNIQAMTMRHPKKVLLKLNKTKFQII